MVAVDQDTGKLDWDDKLPSSPYGAATVTNDVVFTTTFNGHLYAFNAATGAILLNTPLSAATNAPVTIDGDYVIVGAGATHPRATPADHRLQARSQRQASRHWGLIRAPGEQIRSRDAGLRQRTDVSLPQAGRSAA